MQEVEWVLTVLVDKPSGTKTTTIKDTAYLPVKVDGIHRSSDSLTYCEGRCC